MADRNRFGSKPGAALSHAIIKVRPALSHAAQTPIPLSSSREPQTRDLEPLGETLGQGLDEAL